MDYAGLGILGAVIAGLSGLYYFWTILNGQTKPHRITWFGWSLVGVLGVWSAFDGGAGSGALVAATDAAIVVIVFFLSLLPGHGKSGGRRFDYVISVVATLAIIIWRVGHFSPELAATMAILADLWFTWLTIRECWHQPETEALGPWISGTIATALGVAALNSFGYAAAAFPVYIMVGSCVITSVLLARRTIVNKTPHDLHPPIL